MAMTLARALLPLLAVTMVTTAAPLAEPATGEEVAVAATGDNSDTVGIAKRAKEEMLFGNQQNSARLGAAKKSLEPEQQQLLPQDNNENAPETVPQQEPASEQQDKAQDEPEPAQPTSADGVDQAVVQEKEAEQQPEAGKNPEQLEHAEEAQSSEKESAVPGEQPSSGDDQEPQPAADQSNPTETQDSEIPPQQPPAPQQSSEEAEEETEKEEESQPQPVEGGEHGTGEVEEEELENNDLPLVPLQEGGVLSASHDSSENSRNEEMPQPSEPAAEDSADEDQLPEAGNSPGPDSEEALQALGQPQDVDGSEDDMEDLLKDLHNDNIQVAEEPEDEGTAERELMQVSNQVADGQQGGNSDYRQSLLKYILAHGDEYGHLSPPQTNGYIQTDPYYLQRRRRSLAFRRSRLPHIHRRRQHGVEKELSRAKRTKRDLFDDNLYYNLDLPYTRQQEEEQEEEEEEKNAELQELITYLMALYPALYGEERPSPQLPAYLWQPSPNYPEEEEEEVLEAEEPYWAEAPVYEDPRVEWGEPELEVPPPPAAWEPSFYPEEVEEAEQEEEEPDFYPMVAKREMMSFVPGQRRKRYFFPFAREPYTHWGAFVPSQEKREYYGEGDAYSRLRELAMVLAEDRREPSYFDTLDDYNKK